MFLIIPAVVFVLVYTVCAAFYRKTDYFRVTGKLLISVLLDKGRLGEYLTYKRLKSYEKDGAKFLFNCYLPKNNGQTTEVDLIMLHHSGIYVIESKNYGGWIFGSENAKTWTQTLPSGRKAHKEHFLNPIMQNKLHIKWLDNLLGDSYPTHSVIVFSERCTFKNVDVSSTDIFVIRRKSVLRTVRKIAKRTGDVLVPNQIEKMYACLYPYTQVSDEIKKKHIEDIKAEHLGTTGDISDNRASFAVSDGASPVVTSDTQLICPRCGGKLVLRVSERGEHAGKQFYGCGNFPKCRYMMNLQ